MIPIAKRLAAAGCLTFALALFGAVSTLQAQPQTSAQWLEWSGEAREQTSFVGSLLYQHGDAIETVRIWHAADTGNGVRERLQSLSGPHREILRDDAVVTCVLPASDSRFIDSRQLRNPLSARIPSDITALEPHYASQLGNQDRVAGRQAQQVRLTPQDGLRYGYALWFDDQSGVLLRAEVISPSGEVIERLMMLDIEIRERITDAELRLTETKPGLTRVTKPLGDIETASNIASGWSLAAPPPGFELEMDELQEISGRPQPVRHLMVSDGLASVSIYIEALEATNPIQGPLQMGAMSAFGRAIAGHQIIAVGEVPASTVKRIAQAVNPPNLSKNAGN